MLYTWTQGFMVFRWIFPHSFLPQEVAAPPEVRKPKMSDAIRKAHEKWGFTRGRYSTCVIGRAFQVATGYSLSHTGGWTTNDFYRSVSSVFGIPVLEVIAVEREFEVLGRDPLQIAAELEAKGY